MGANGLAYASRLDGKIFEYDPDTGNLRYMKSLVKTKGGLVSMWRSGVVHPGRKKMYVIHQSTSALLEFDPIADTIKEIGSIAVPTVKTTRPKNAFFSQLGIRLKGDTIYYAGHGPAIYMAGVHPKNQRQQAYLISFDLKTNTVNNHGAMIVYDNRVGMRRAFYTSSVEADDKGGVYVSAILETKDPARVQAIKDARGHAAPGELTWAPYQMQLLYISPAMLKAPKELDYWKK